VELLLLLAVLVVEQDLLDLLVLQAQLDSKESVDPLEQQELQALL
jgi:hypothetical protein